MAYKTPTPNLGLIEPEPGTGEKIRLSDINSNWDTLDARIGAVPNTTNLQAQITALAGDTSAKTRALYLTSSVDTWPEVWAAISTIPIGGSATILFHNNAYNAFSNGARSTGSPCGTITRLGDGSFSAALTTLGLNVISVTVTGASSSNTGTYSERPMLATETAQHSFPSITNGSVDGSTIQIQTGDDLNDYNIPGTYICTSGTIAQTLLNCPSEIGGNFKLFVNVNTGNASGTGGWWGCQIIQSGESLFIRMHAGESGNTFGAWRRFDNRDLTNLQNSTEFSWESGFQITTNDSYCYVTGRMIDLSVVSVSGVSLTNNMKLGTVIVQANRPWKTVCVSIYDWNSGKPLNGSVWIYSSGDIRYFGDPVSNTKLIFKATWVI